MTQTDNYQGPLAGLNAIDFGHYYAGPMAGMLLADQGASVIRIVKPGQKELPEQQYRLLNRHKKLLTLDLKTSEGKQQALSLIERADVVIENFRPGVMKRLGLDYASVKNKNPGVVYLSLPGFASTDKERAPIQAWEGVISAAACIYTRIHQVRHTLKFPPVYSAVPICSSLGSMQGVIAVMAAIVAREQNGMGTVIEVPLVDAGFSCSGAMFVIGAFDSVEKEVETDNELPDNLKPFAYALGDSSATQLEKLEQAREIMYSVSPFYGKIYTCKDGRKVMVCLPGHTKLIARFFEILGIHKQVMSEGFVNDGPWKDYGLSNNVSGMAKLSPERLQRLTQLVTDAFLTKTAEQWDALFEEGVSASFIRTRKEWLTLEPMLNSGVLVRMGSNNSTDSAKASVLTVPGRTVDISGPKDMLMDTTPKEAEWIDFVQAESLFNNATYPKASRDVPLPLKKGDLLKDLKVLDLSNILAGPASSLELAQYGAQVIKADPSNTSGMNHTPYLLPALLNLSQGKRSILTDTTTAPGQEILRRLIGWADVVVHNCLDDTARRLGIAQDQLRAINPNVVGCQISAYGGTYRGSWETRPGFDWQPHSSSGLMIQYGSANYPSLHGMVISGDIMGGLGLAFTSLLAVYQQRKTGWAGEGRTSLARAFNYTQLPWMIAENGNSDWGEAQGQFALGESWWQRLYACRDGWIYVGTSETSAGVLAETVVGQQTEDEKILEARFSEQTCGHWLKKLTDIGIGCHRVMSGDDMYDACAVRLVDNNEADETSTEELDILRWEDHPCGKPVNMVAMDHVRVGENHSWKRLKPAPRLGEHTKEILTELGYTEDEISELIRLKVSHDYLPALGSKDAYLFEPEKQA